MGTVARGATYSMEAWGSDDFLAMLAISYAATDLLRHIMRFLHDHGTAERTTASGSLAHTVWHKAQHFTTDMRHMLKTDSFASSLRKTVLAIP